MSLQEQYDAIQVAIEALRKDARGIDERLGVMWQRRNELRTAIAKEQGLLQAITWEFHNSRYSPSLTAKGVFLDNCEELAKLFDVNSMGHFSDCGNLWKGEGDDGFITLSFDDGEIGICFEYVTTERMVDFIREWGLKIEAEGLQYQKDGLLEQLATIEQTMDLIRQMGQSK
jgi:hypothetical protein